MRIILAILISVFLSGCVEKETTKFFEVGVRRVILEEEKNLRYGSSFYYVFKTSVDDHRYAQFKINKNDCPFPFSTPENKLVVKFSLTMTKYKTGNREYSFDILNKEELFQKFCVP